MTEPTRPDSAGAVHRSIAERLNRLFIAIRPSGENREYQGKEVVAAIRAAGGEMSESYLSELRRGIKPNPTIRHLDALAEFFGVRPGYFTDDLVAEEVEAELELRSAMRKANVKDLALRVANLGLVERAAMNRLLAQIITEHDEP
ncbi:MAG: helix-turn-helix domain-containing protein [Pseudonocardiaceae bacterium]